MILVGKQNLLHYYLAVACWQILNPFLLFSLVVNNLFDIVFMFNKEYSYTFKNIFSVRPVLHSMRNSINNYLLLENLHVCLGALQGIT